MLLERSVLVMSPLVVAVGIHAKDEQAGALLLVCPVEPAALAALFFTGTLATELAFAKVGAWRADAALLVSAGSAERTALRLHPE